MKWTLELYKKNVDRLAHFISGFAENMGRVERRLAATQYIEGLLLPGRRKYILSVAQRLRMDPQRLQQFLTDSPWDDQELWRVIRRTMIPALEPHGAWIIYERTWVKQGFHSVGVSQHEHAVNGKKANCQVSLELLVSDGLVAAPVASRLYLPKIWIANQKFREQAEVPKDIIFASKASIALHLIEQALLDGVAPSTVLAGSKFGENASFRSGLCRLDMEFFLRVSPSTLSGFVFDQEENGAAMDSQQQPATGPMSLSTMIKTRPAQHWHSCCWTTSTGTKESTRLMWFEISLVPHPDAAREEQERLWLIIDWPSNELQPYGCYVASLQRPPTLTRCLRFSRSHSYIENYLGRFDKDLDLGCYQGRSWRGFHHHLVLSAAAYLFTLSVEQRNRGTLWPDVKDKSDLDTAVVQETERIKSLL